MSIITPCALYGCSAWTLNVDSENFLRKTQRRLLRIVFGSGRRMVESTEENASTHSSEDRNSVKDDQEDAGESLGSLHLEPWEDWIRRTTRQAEEQLRVCGLEDWTAKYRQRKWRLARKIWTLDAKRWAKTALNWDASEDPTLSRRVGRPTSRWTDGFNVCVHRTFGKEAGTSWKDVITHDESWASLEPEFLR